MRAFGGWTVVGLAALCGVIAAPAQAHGGAAPAATIADVVELRAARWVVAVGVRLRGGPSDDAPVLGRVGINTSLQLRGQSGDWCDVERADGARGWIACRYLGDAPLDLAAITDPYADGGSNAHYDPRLAFEIAPQWSTLETYALLLHERRRAVGDTGPAPTDPTLEWMKTELAKGAYGAAPPRRVDVGDLQDFAAEAGAAGSPPDVRRLAGDEVREKLQLWAEPYYHDSARALAVMASVYLPPVRSSWFADDAALAAGDEAPDVLSGRFGIIHRQVVTPASRTDALEGWAFYDMGSVTHMLGRPLQKVQLFADGRLLSGADRARRTRTLSQNLDHPMCEGWTPGFALGDLAATDAAWRSFDAYWPTAKADSPRATGSLYAIYVDAPLPATTAALSVTDQKMDVGATGFVAATSYAFDIDHDAVPDVLVWEAKGPGPGHMDSPTGTDDTWYRLMLANVGGRWHLLGTDQFSYGCGC